MSTVKKAEGAVMVSVDCGYCGLGEFFVVGRVARLEDNREAIS